MTWTLVQSITANNDLSGATLAAALTNPVTSGNAVLITESWADTSTASTTDNVGGNTYTLLDIQDDNTATGGPQSSGGLATVNITNGPKTFTLNNSPATTFRDITVEEWSFSGGPSAGIDAHTGATNANLANNATFSTGNITTTVNGDLIWSCSNSGTASVPANAGTGFTRNNTVGGEATEALTQSSAGTTAGTWVNVNGAAQDYMCNVIALKPAAAAANIPFINKDFPNPSAPPSIDRTWVWRQVGMLGRDVLPNRQQDWPNPVPPPRIEQTWLWRQVDKLGKDTLPNRQQDWPNPVPPPKIEQTWWWRQTGMFGQDRLPNRQQDWPNPIGPPQIDRTWVQGFSLPLTTVVIVFPHNQYDWPNPAPAPQIDRTWLWSQTRMFGQDFLPFRQQDWLNPAPPPAISQTWVQSLNLSLSVAPTPFNQFDWPNPVAPPRIDETWAWSQTRMFGQDILPFRQQDWPLPPPVPVIDRAWVQGFSLPIATFVAPPLPHNQYDWPNPLAPPTIDHVWSQGFSLPLATFVPPPPTTFEWLIRARRRGRR